MTVPRNLRPVDPDDPGGRRIIEVHSQREFDAALAAARDADLIVCLGTGAYRAADPRPRIGVYDTAHLVMSGGGEVHVAGSASADLDGSMRAIAFANSTVRATGVATVEARAESNVRARGHVSVIASGSALVDADDDVLVIAMDMATVVAAGRAVVEWYATPDGTPGVTLRGDAQGHDGGERDPEQSVVERVAGEAAAFAEERLTLLRRRITG